MVETTKEFRRKKEMALTYSQALNSVGDNRNRKIRDELIGQNQAENQGMERFGGYSGSKYIKQCMCEIVKG